MAYACSVCGKGVPKVPAVELCQRENMGTELVRPGSFRTHVYKRLCIILPCVIMLSDNQWFLKCILTSLAAKHFSGDC